MRLNCWTLAWIASLGGFAMSACDDGGGDLVDEMPDDLPAGNCGVASGGQQECETDGTSSATASAGGTTTTGVSGECQSSADCLGNDVCVASWNAQTQTPGEAECSFSCIPNYDDAQWCSDDAACCDPEATCAGRGYCVLSNEGADSGSTSGSGDSGSTSDGSSGSGSGSSSSSSGGSSSTGGVE